MKVNLITLGCYFALGVAMSYVAPGEWTTEQLVAYFAVLGIVLLIDVLSYKSGIARGGQIAHDVFDELCKDKKVRLVRYE